MDFKLYFPHFFPQQHIVIVLQQRVLTFWMMV